MPMNHKARRYFVFAGEPSGDLHGKALLSALKKQTPSLKLSGVGGPLMREEGIECILPMEAFCVMGFSDVITAFPRLYRQFHQVKDAILDSNPDGVILIDYPGFNLRLAKALRKRHYSGKIIQLISPSVWAWGKKRVVPMAETLDLLLTIYPFESDYFATTSLPVKYIGNPLVEALQRHTYDDAWRQKLGLPQKPLIALFPGSRSAEIERNLPIQLEAASLFKKAHPDVLFAISCAEEKQRPILQLLLEKSSLSSSDVFLIPKAFTYELMRDSRTAIAKSGTVTLELALHNRPTLVVYQLSLLNQLIAKYLLRLRLPYYCIVNILNGRMVFPEWIAQQPNPEQLFHSLEALHSEGEVRKNTLQGCHDTRQLLGAFNTSELAAQYIEEVMKT